LDNGAMCAPYKNQMLNECCGNNHLNAAMWITRTYNITEFEDCNSPSRTIQLLCKRGHFDVLKWIFATFRTVKVEIKAISGAFGLACGYGHLEIKWIAKTMNIIQPEDIDSAVYHTCRRGHLNIFRWLFETFDIDIHGRKMHIPFYAVCVNGHLEAAKLIAERFNYVISVFDIKTAMCRVCEHGHLDVAKWLAATYCLDANYFKPTYDNVAFRDACSNGRLDIAMWIAESFNINADDIRHAGNHIIHLACLHGHLHVVKWLVATYGLTADDVYSLDGIAFNRTRDSGFSDVITWLTETFGAYVAE
jgi:hypothetical protein